MDHNQYLTQAARAHLRPLGFVQKGRSRTWLWDRRWHLLVVEFQPSSWSRGSYLNVGATLLWAPKAHVTFDLGGRVAPFSPLEDEAQFADTAESLALHAVRESTKLYEHLESFEAVALAFEEVESSLGFYHRAIAMGLAGRLSEAVRLFDRLRSDATEGAPDWVLALYANAATLSASVRSAQDFLGHVNELVVSHRSMLKLAHISEPLRSAS
jgi:hypothetical protein